MFGTCSGPVRDPFGFQRFFHFFDFFDHFAPPEGVRNMFGTCSGPVRAGPFDHFFDFLALARAASST